MPLIGLDSGRDFDRLRRVVRFVEGLMGGPQIPRTRTPPGGPPVHFVKPTAPADGDGFASALLQYWDSDAETWQDDGEVVYRDRSARHVVDGNRRKGRARAVPIDQYHRSAAGLHLFEARQVVTHGGDEHPVHPELIEGVQV